MADPAPTRQWRTGGMTPPDELLADVLPAGKLGPDGRPVRALRDELRRIPNVRNALTVAVAWAQIVGVVAAAVWLDHPLAWLAGFLLMGRSFALLAILAHEAAHRLLFTHRRVNDLVGRWLLAYPAFVAYDVYRRVHMAHHRQEFGPDEPDMNFYEGFPCGWRSLARKLGRDALGVSGWRNLVPLFRALRSPSSRPTAVSILATQAVLLAAATAAGRPELYLFYWLLPWMTVWRVLNRLRSIAEHGGLERSSDRRRTTHHVRQSLLPRFWFVPYRTGWHLAHHVDSGIPFRSLPRLQDELDRVGYTDDALTWPSYTALWKALATGRPDRVTA